MSITRNGLSLLNKYFVTDVLEVRDDALLTNITYNSEVCKEADIGNFVIFKTWSVQTNF